MFQNRIPVFLFAVVFLTAMAQAQPTFIPICIPTVGYVGGTTLIPIAVPNGTPVPTLTDGIQTVTFSSPFTAATVGPGGGWATWGAPPFVESSTPRVLTFGGTTATLTLAVASPTFGFEIEPNNFGVHPITATFFNGATVLGTVTLNVQGNRGALLSAGSVTLPITSVQISAPGSGGVAIAQLRYGSVMITDNGCVISDGSYQVRYLSNLNVADSFINIVNVGSVNGNDPAGRICANIYVFDPNEEPVSCCACPITPNGLVSLSAVNSLISNPLTFNNPTSIVVKILFTPTTGSCDAGALPTTTAPLPAAFPFPFPTLARGGQAWATTVHGLIPNGQANPTSYASTETRFDNSGLSPTEYVKLVSVCNFIQTYASRFGLCRGCQNFGRGGAAQ